jgi:hypothetical protein
MARSPLVGVLTALLLSTGCREAPRPGAPPDPLDSDQRAVLRLCALPPETRFTAFSASPPLSGGGWQREGLTISATALAPPDWIPSGYAKAPAPADREACERFASATRSANPPNRRLFEEASAVRCVTAGNDLLHAPVLAPCSTRATLADLIVCSVAPIRANPAAPVEVRVELRASY